MPHRTQIALVLDRDTGEVAVMTNRPDENPAAEVGSPAPLERRERQGAP